MSNPSAAGTHPTIVAVVGNPRPSSRTLSLAALVAERLARLTSAPSASVVVLDLARLTEQLGAPLGADSAARWRAPLASLHAADVLVVATPTYKGSYTGLLKSFLDHVGADALAGAVAVPVTTVGGPAHTLAADVHLRPLLLELGASTPTTALVVGEQSLDAPDDVVDAWVARNAAQLRAAAAATVS
ncbi:NADPH-dependent FMN reductase [Angustibacter aerolatus]